MERTITRDIKYTLVLTEEEARYLRSRMQNPPPDCIETETENDIRRNFFEAVKGAA